MAGFREWLQRIRTRRSGKPVETSDRVVDDITKKIDYEIAKERTKDPRGFELNISAPEVHGSETPLLEAEVIGGRKGLGGPASSGNHPGGGLDGGEGMFRSQRLSVPPALKATYQDARITKVELTLQKLSEKFEKMKEAETKLRSELDEVKETVKRMEIGVIELEEMREGYSRVERTVFELTSLYDLISAQINPFIDLDEQQLALYRSRDKVGLGFKPKRRSGEEGIDDSALEHISDAVNPFIEASRGLPARPMSFASGDMRTPPAALATEEELTVRWAQFLLDRLSPNGVAQLLDQYVGVNIIDEDLKDRVIQIMNSNKVEIKKELDITEAQAEDLVIDSSGEIVAIADGEDWRLPLKDQMQNLQFIDQLLRYQLADEKR